MNQLRSFDYATSPECICPDIYLSQSSEFHLLPHANACPATPTEYAFYRRPRNISFDDEVTEPWVDVDHHRRVVKLRALLRFGAAVLHTESGDKLLKDIRAELVQHGEV